MINLEKRHHEIIIHSIFWIAFFLVSTSLTVGIFGKEQWFVRVGAVTSTFVALVYFNYYFLLPRFFMRKEYGGYMLWLLVAIAVITQIRIEMDVFFIGSKENMVVHMRTPMHYLTVVITYVLLIFSTSAFRFIRDAYRKAQLEKELENYKLDAELKFLKTQVNPHFLFNTLNNIYSLSQVNSPKTSEMVMKLSHMMRYMIYDAAGDRKKVPLEKEIEYLQNYIDLQQLRTREKQNVKLAIEGNITNVMIEPMLFVPLLENSFKHGNPDDIENGWITCSLKVVGEEVEFTVTNSLAKEAQRKDKVGGIGLENVMKRLELLYPCRHACTNQIQSGIFTSKIKIELA